MATRPFLLRRLPCNPHRERPGGAVRLDGPHGVSGGECQRPVFR
jgi:hypothetical protein